MNTLLKEEVEFDQYDLDPSSFFIHEYSYTVALEIIEDLKIKKIWVNSNFEDQKWKLRTDIKKNQFKYLDFSSYTKEISLSVKCWMLNLLQDIAPSTSLSINLALQKSLKYLDNLESSKFDIMFENLVEASTSENENTIFYVLSICISYFTYISQSVDNYDMEEFINKLLQLKQKFSPITRPRDLPPYLDVQKFSYMLYDFFLKCSINDIKLFLPIKIWWTLTSIIPLRSGEFVDIPRDCLVSKNNGYFIKLPRKKQPATSQTLEVIDILPIPKQIYDDIKNYINYTKSYGSTKSLLSYRAYKSLAGIENKPRRHVNKDYFLLANFAGLLDLFFTRLELDYNVQFISKKDYNYQNETLNYIKKKSSVDTSLFKNTFTERINSKIIVKPQPNDTRHFSICNMMLQGIDPLLIARSAGHQHLESQYHYQGHLEYFVESSTYDLLIKKSISTNPLLFQNEGINRLDIISIRNKSIAPKEMFSYLDEVDIGYCTDKEMKCESRFCIFCKHNYIPLETLELNISEIERNIIECSSRIKTKARFLETLYKSASYDYKLGRFIDPTNLEDIKRASKQLNGEMEDYTTLFLNIGGVKDGW